MVKHFIFVKDECLERIKQLEKVEIEGLFHKYNYVIPLNNDERITIIHGINATGKTTILTLVNDFFSTCYLEIQRIPYHIIRFTFNDSIMINIYKTFFFLASQSLKDKRYDSLLIDEDIYKDRRIFFEILSPYPQTNNVGVFSFDGDSFEEYKCPLKTLDPHKILSIKNKIREDIQNFNFLQRISDDTYYKTVEMTEEIDNNKLKDLEKNISTVTKKINLIEEKQKKINLQLSSEVMDYDNFNSTIDLIGRHESDKELERMYTGNITKLQKIIDSNNKKILFLKTEIAQLNDIRNQLTHKLKKPKIVNKLTLPHGEEKIITTRFIKTSRLISKNWSTEIENFSHHISRHLKDKDPVSDKIFLTNLELYREIIETFLHDKTVVSNNKEGLVFIDKRTRFKIYPEQLSSGEKHIIFIFLNLIFKTSKEDLVLIDEPEISLHITWQMRFLEMLFKISKIKDIDIVISTHSPNIVYDREDLLVKIGE